MQDIPGKYVVKNLQSDLTKASHHQFVFPMLLIHVASIECFRVAGTKNEGMGHLYTSQGSEGLCATGQVTTNLIFEKNLHVIYGTVFG